jgi:hypothetical protein
MTHRIDSRRWQQNPEHRVSQTQLNRVKQAANPGKPLPASRSEVPAREPQVMPHSQ